MPGLLQKATTQRLSFVFSTPLEPLQGVKQVVIIDPQVEDYQSLVAGTLAGIQPYVLHPTEDPLEQISQIVAQLPDLQTLHIVCHGAPGHLYLGETVVNRQTLSQYRHHMEQWQVETLAIWACEVGQDPEFLEEWGELTGSNIVASQEKLGNGNWQLETQVGDLGAQNPFNTTVEKTYTGILAHFSPASNCRGCRVRDLSVGRAKSDDSGWC